MPATAPRHVRCGAAPGVEDAALTSPATTGARARDTGHPGRGAAVVWRAARLLARRRDLWPLCAAPLLLAVGAALLALALYVGVVVEPVWAWLGITLDTPEASRWWQWLWLGPLAAVAWLGRVVLAVACLVALYLALSALAAVLAAPFLDALSRAVERSVRGTVREGAGGWRSVWLTMGNELRRVAALAAIAVGVTLVGLVPGGQVLAVLIGALCAASFLALEHTGPVLDRREMPFAARRRWLWRHRGTLLGFGAAAAASYAIPGLNLACLPLLTAAGTLLALDLEPDVGAATSPPSTPASATADAPPSRPR
jgi:uncharacterized protein involved in cysteine biosynthesis